jgi:hypothetical protein
MIPDFNSSQISTAWHWFTLYLMNLTLCMLALQQLGELGFIITSSFPQGKCLLLRGVFDKKRKNFMWQHVTHTNNKGKFDMLLITYWAYNHIHSAESSFLGQLIFKIQPFES